MPGLTVFKNHGCLVADGSKKSYLAHPALEPGQATWHPHFGFLIHAWLSWQSEDLGKDPWDDACESIVEIKVC